MDANQLVIRFVLGGSVVVLATVVADVSKNPFVTGIAACFPGIIFATSVALMLAGHPPEFLSRYFLGSLGGIAVTVAFVLSSSALVGRLGFWPGVGAALGVWFVLAGAVVTIMQRLRA